MYYIFITGFKVQPHDVQSPFTMRAHVICAAFDLPAKALVYNTIQFNGKHGCGYCEQPGKTLRTERGGNIHTIPYNASSPKGILRTKQSCLKYAKEAYENQSVVWAL